MSKLNKNQSFLAILMGALLVCGLLFISCPTSMNEDPIPSRPRPGQKSVIKHQPTSRDYVIGQDTEILPLVVEAEGDYTYQWYSNNTFSAKNGTLIEGATESEYVPDMVSLTTAGEYYFYATITSERTSTESAPARIRVVEAPPETDVEFTITNDKYNFIRGFGGTGAFMFWDGPGAGGSPDVDVDYIDLLMGPDNIGGNILRVMVTAQYERMISNDLQSHQGTLFQDNARNWFAVIRRVNEYGGYVYANPWTAPAHMKFSGREVGGKETGGAGSSRLRPEFYVDYANHLRDFARWCHDNRAPIYAIGVLNEPDWGGSTDYEGMDFSRETHRDWFQIVGHFTTEKVTNRTQVNAVSGIDRAKVAQREYDPIPGYGGGKETPYVKVMTADSMGDIQYYLQRTYEDKQTPDDPNGIWGAYHHWDIAGRHYYASAIRWTDHVGQRGTTRENKPDVDFVPPQEWRRHDPNDKTSWGLNGQREVWQTERHGDIPRAGFEPLVYQWGRFTFDLLNEMDHMVRINDESVYDHWYSQCYWGLVPTDDEHGAVPHTITARGRAFAHYARYAKHVYRLGINLTRGAIAEGWNPYHEDPAEKLMTTTHLRITPFIDALNGDDPEYITLVVHSGTTSSYDHIGAGDEADRDITIVFPEGFVAKTAYAWRSWGAYPDQYWQDDLVVLANDGKSATFNMKEKTIISLKFTK